ncbi:hypothetical protein F4808DRAFT_463272 [Astrocystis sublimbata]|nr:hypothetical protein F4808DRAFT_463272 [Astrocystis sublimbata]
MAFVKNFKYSSLISRRSDESGEEDQRLVDGKDDLGLMSYEKTKPKLNYHLFHILPWVIALVSSGLLLYTILRGPNEFSCTRLLNPYSPPIEDGVVEYYDLNFENEFAHKSKFRGPPTPELEEAWDQLWNFGGIEVPLDGPARLGKGSDNLLHIDKDKSRGYSAMLEAFHQVHCLNLIRQFTWRDYYDENLSEWLNKGHNHRLVDLEVSNNASVGDRMHVDHCIETLRLQLMCNADMTPLFIIEDDSNPLGAKADFNVHHKCRRWDRLVDWQRTHNIDNKSLGDHSHD